MVVGHAARRWLSARSDFALQRPICHLAPWGLTAKRQRYVGSYIDATTAPPGMLVSVPMVIDGDEYMDRAELAEYLGVAQATISSWASRDRMPAPARYVARSPLWLVSEIKAWEATRPGKGGWRREL